MAKLYLPFAETLYDQDAPVGELGRGTHYSVLRVLSWTDAHGIPTLVAGNQDLAVVWDEDHDDRVMTVVERLYAERLLYPVMFIGERKGLLTVIVAPHFTSQLHWFESVVESIAQELIGDPWATEVNVYPEPGSIISDSGERVVTYLKHIDALWQLGFKQRTVPIPAEFGPPYRVPLLRPIKERSHNFSDFNREARRTWLAVMRSLLGAAQPEQMTWTRLQDIMRVLALVAQDSNCNHMLLPSSGGMDLEAVERAGEPGCLALVTSSHAAIVRPAKLTLECLPEHVESSFLRLDVEPLKPKSRHRASDGKENLLEVGPGEYIEPDETEEGARHVARYFRGPFVIVAKHSSYNDRPYDDLHVSKSSTEFRKVVERVAGARAATK